MATLQYYFVNNLFIKLVCYDLLKLSFLKQYRNANRILSQAIDYLPLFSFFCPIHANSCSLEYFYTRFSLKSTCNILLYRI